MEKKKRKKKRKSPLRVALERMGIFISSTLVMAFVGLYGVMFIVAKGPSETAQRLFVMSVKETSAIGFLANWFYSDEEIAEIVGNGRNSDVDEDVNVALIQIEGEKNKVSDKTDDNPEAETKDLELVDIIGPTYKGKMLIIKDPSRVFVGVSGEFGADKSGRTVKSMTESYQCIAGTNAGGFSDPNGVGKGGVPLGIVFSQGEMKWGSKSQEYEIIGFDKNNILHVGKMTGQEALDADIRDAVGFGPILIVNGNAQNETEPLGGGLNPRTAIGQRADGAVLLLVIDGRQASSLGATYDDLIDVMEKYGAVNAANLDGGSSSHLVYEGEIVTICSSLYGPRNIPTSILVK